ncbi:MAG: dihydropteroate synthase [Actinomycetota bacterium]
MSGPLWRVGARTYDCSERTLVMGILNVTPDSFSDGRQFDDADTAVQHALAMVADGADILDVGGESTRPGSDTVPADEEIARITPVVESLVRERVGAPVSIDTRKAEVARVALEAGATIVNDVTAGLDPDMFGVVADANAAMVLMHMQGEPKSMQVEPAYDDVVAEVAAYLESRVANAVNAGIDFERLCIDPGIGFGKTLDHNLSLMKHLDALGRLERPVLVGPSRKAFIGTLLGLDVDERLEGTAAAVAYLAAAGAHIVRVHDVREMVRVSRMIDAIARAE